MQLPIRKAGDKLFGWVEKMTEGAETIRQENDRVTVGVLRLLMVPDLKTYMDLTKTTERQEYQILVEQWEKSKEVCLSM